MANQVVLLDDHLGQLTAAVVMQVAAGMVEEAQAVLEVQAALAALKAWKLVA